VFNTQALHPSFVEEPQAPELHLVHSQNAFHLV
jgi:hypothetical protein